MLRIITICLGIAMLGVSLAWAADSGKPITGRWAVITTNKGTIKVALYEKDAPITTKNFIELANKKFYDGLTFHRVVPGFVIQGGDPNGDGSGGSDKTIPLEVKPNLKHDAAGVMAMARAMDPNSASSQFYITLAAQPDLDMKYAVFGRVVQGLDVVMKIERGDVMKSIRIVAPPKPETAKSSATKNTTKQTTKKQTNKTTTKKITTIKKQTQK